MPTKLWTVVSFGFFALACSPECPGFRSGFVDFVNSPNVTVSVTEVRVSGNDLEFTYRRAGGDTRGTPYEAYLVERGTNFSYTAPVRFSNVDRQGVEHYIADLSTVPPGDYAINITVYDGAPMNFEVGAEGGVARSGCSGDQPNEPDVTVVRR